MTNDDNENSGSRNCYAAVLEAAREIDNAVGGTELARMPRDVAKLIVKLKRWIQDGDVAAKTEKAEAAESYREWVKSNGQWP